MTKIANKNKNSPDLTEAERDRSESLEEQNAFWSAFNLYFAWFGLGIVLVGTGLALGGSEGLRLLVNIVAGVAVLALLLPLILGTIQAVKTREITALDNRYDELNNKGSHEGLLES